MLCSVCYCTCGVQVHALPGVVTVGVVCSLDALLGAKTVLVVCRFMLCLVLYP